MPDTKSADTILDHYAKMHTGFLHANGKEATRLLIGEIQIKPGMTVLEIGCGTAATISLLASQNRNSIFFGVDHSESMINVAERRIKFAGLTKNLHLKKTSANILPFENNSIDIVYAESVLGIQRNDGAGELMKEIYRVLKPQGQLFLNETIWMEGTATEEIITLNKFCLQAFGIIQASEKYPFALQWQEMIAANGFDKVVIKKLDEMKNDYRPKKNFSALRSGFFSYWGKVKGSFYFSARKLHDENMNRFNKLSVYEKCMEGVFITAVKKADH